MLKHCTRCVMPSTRPRITFNAEGVCNACQWAEEKKTAVDWEARWKELEVICDKYKSRTGNFDIVIPVSGGKDSCYVTYKMNHELGMHPLLVTVTPPLSIDIGNENLTRLINSGYDVIQIHPNPKITREISRIELFDFGDPLMSWIISARSGIFKIAVNFNIPLIMWGEEGEVEYGGVSDSKNTPTHDRNFEIKYLISNNNPTKYLDSFTEKELNFWLFPTQEEFDRVGIQNMHMNYFDPWDPYRNYVIAKRHFNIKEKKGHNVGTYTNYGQTDTILFDLHMYFAFLKFGFGRTTADASIDVRRGALDREQAIELVRKFDHLYPEPYNDQYLDYFELTQEEFDAAVDKHANKRILKKVNGRWVPNFEIN